MKHITVICGGQSPEHEISLRSAQNILKYIDKSKYIVSCIYISKEGVWNEVDARWYENGDIFSVKHNPVALKPVENSFEFVYISDDRESLKSECIFPILHGENGEDGTMQGLCEMFSMPYVGCDVFSSALCMDKHMAKVILENAGIQVAPYVVMKKNNDIPSFTDITKTLNVPLFVKPARTGSSVGVSKVVSEDDYKKAIEKALTYDSKILIEQGIEGDEIECAVMGNDNPEASVIGKVIPMRDGFYSYEGKYEDENGAAFEMPAQYTEDVTNRIQDKALEIYKVLGCAGMARVDMFLTKDDSIILNEVNTIPGFTDISMYPKLWELTGVPYAELLDRLIAFACDR